MFVRNSNFDKLTQFRHFEGIENIAILLSISLNEIEVVLQKNVNFLKHLNNAGYLLCLLLVTLPFNSKYKECEQFRGIPENFKIKINSCFITRRL